MIRFEHPWFLALLPLILGLFIWRGRRARPAVVFSSLDGVRDLPRTMAQRLKRVLPVMEMLGLLMLAVAMARPQSGREDISMSSHGIAVQLLIDRSDSMRAEDLDEDRWDRDRITRLDVVKDVVSDFIDEEGELPGRPRDLVGLVSFAGYVKTHCPLTLDHGLLLELLQAMNTPSAPRGDELLMTAMGDALVIGVAHLDEVTAESKVLILLSDGRSNIGVTTPSVGADAAAEKGVKVYTVGIGTLRGGLDEPTLKLVAEKTGGRYFNARTASDLEEVYRTIDRLERSDIESFSATRWKDLFPAWLWIGVGLLVVHRALADTRFRGLP